MMLEKMAELRRRFLKISASLLHSTRSRCLWCVWSLGQIYL